MALEDATAAVIWLTGLPCSGKSTIGAELAKQLAVLGKKVEHIDGDAVRQVVPGIGFRREDRESYLRHVGFLCSVLERQGITVVASFVSPYRSARDFSRGLCKTFLEVYISTPLAICEGRDTKQQYARARKGEITHFTGVDDPYEEPASPELTFDTSSVPADECVRRILSELKARKII